MPYTPTSTTPVRDARDSFLHFLADNLGVIPIHAVREDPNDPSAALLQSNAINVHFLNISLENIATQQAVIDVLNDDENTAVDWVTRVWQLLRSAFYTPAMNYSVPTAPVSTNTNIMWDRNGVKFVNIAARNLNNYTHYSCILALKFSAII